MILKSNLTQPNLSKTLISIKAFVESRSMLKYWSRGNRFTIKYSAFLQVF